jgi:tetratricopeptide (TPR) repeat protein
MLGGLPLALVQAGAYLRETGTTVADYMEYYKNTWEDLMQSQSRSLLQENGGESVLTIWKMSYEQIKSTDMLAAKLLDLWAFLHRDDVWPELVLTSQANSELLGLVESSSFIRATKLSLTNSIGTLARFSMINRGTSSRSHSIHPVVHTWCLHNLTTPVARNEMLAIAISLVAQMIQVLPEDLTRHTKLRLAAHAKTVGSRMESLTVSTELADNCDQIATFLAGWEKSDEVETLYRQALLGKERHLGPDHLSTLQTVNKLGNLYAGQGKTASAEEMYQRALQGKENTLGPEHTQTLATVNNLGLLYADQGKMAAAEDMYKRALQGYENAFGPDHTSTLVMVNNLGILYRKTAKTAEAEEMYQRALRGKEKACGPEHTSTLYTVINLGNLYADLGKTAAAEEMYQRALKGYEKVWGPEHTSTLDTLDNLGDLYRKQGRQAAAGEMYQRALAGYESMSRTPKVEARVTQIRESLSSVRVDVAASVSEPAGETRLQLTPASTQSTTSNPHLEPTPSIPRKGLRQAVLALRNRSWSLSSTR